MRVIIYNGILREHPSFCAKKNVKCFSENEYEQDFLFVCLFGFFFFFLHTNDGRKKSWS